MGPSLLHNASRRQTSRAHGCHRSCERHRTQESRCVPGSRSAEAARNHQLFTTLQGKAEDVWSALSALHRERVEDRPGEFGTPQGVSHRRDLRATPRQAHHSALGTSGTLGDQIDGGREMVSRPKAGKPAEEGEAVRRSNHRQDPAHYASGLQAWAAARVLAAAARGESHELGEPANHQRLHGDPYDADAGVRDSPQHSGAEAHAHPERCGHGVASVGVAGPDVDRSGLRGSGDVREACICVGKVQGAEVEGIEGSGSHASSS